eukprot:TRINITY_DN102466_c0_g1_i1.p1 TRINITY_DN102466_c0_g1~~TRINITY_DN102466_c0_g1_i1.p1  ORF type:complete len:377 (-),score=60.96 TRINITY_DN102466_c0_g1_i1:382-1377(-)
MPGGVPMSGAGGYESGARGGMQRPGGPAGAGGPPGWGAPPASSGPPPSQAAPQSMMGGPAGGPGPAGPPGWAPPSNMGGPPVSSAGGPPGSSVGSTAMAGAPTSMAGPRLSLGMSAGTTGVPVSQLGAADPRLGGLPPPNAERRFSGGMPGMPPVSGFTASPVAAPAGVAPVQLVGVGGAAPAQVVRVPSGGGAAPVPVAGVPSGGAAGAGHVVITRTRVDSGATREVQRLQDQVAALQAKNAQLETTATHATAAAEAAAARARANPGTAQGDEVLRKAMNRKTVVNGKKIVDLTAFAPDRAAEGHDTRDRTQSNVSEWLDLTALHSDEED